MKRTLPFAAPLRVLVVDDEPDTVEGWRLLLRLWGCDVRTARTAPEAMDQAAGWDPDAALLDLAMPRATGFDLALRLRGGGGGPRPVLIAVTGLGGPEWERRCREAGFAHHLLKPPDPDRLHAILADLAGQLARGERIGAMPGAECAAGAQEGPPPAGPLEAIARQGDLALKIACVISSTQSLRAMLSAVLAVGRQWRASGRSTRAAQQTRAVTAEYRAARERFLFRRANYLAGRERRGA